VPASVPGLRFHKIFGFVDEEILREPVPCLAQLCLAAQIIELQVELSLFVRGCFFHFHFSLFLRLLDMN